MKFSVAALTAAAFAGLSSAAPILGKSFGLVSIHSGSAIQNSGVSVANDGTLEINSKNKNWFTGKFNDDESVSVGEKFLTVQADGSLRVVDDKTRIFKENGENHLVYGTSASFTARKTNDWYKIIRLQEGTSLNPDDVNVELQIFYD